MFFLPGFRGFRGALSPALTRRAPTLDTRLLNFATIPRYPFFYAKADTAPGVGGFFSRGEAYKYPVGYAKQSNNTSRGHAELPATPARINMKIVNIIIY